jgi:3-hydroxyisobutyrate dehydrogenase-like beta-hydroxyacid dehydrogenase
MHARVSAFDPASVPTPEGVERFDRPADATRGCQLVISITAGFDARAALQQALSSIPRAANYADFSTGAPALKRELAGMADAVGLAFTDVALMGTVPGRGIATPAVASGDGAKRFERQAAELGMNVSVVGTAPGDAATHKLLRSVFVKGFAAVLIEAMEAAEEAGLGPETWMTIVDEIENADEQFLVRLRSGTRTHAARRFGEMAAAVSLLEELGVPATMTSATVSTLRRESDGIVSDEHEAASDGRCINE